MHSRRGSGRDTSRGRGEPGVNGVQDGFEDANDLAAMGATVLKVKVDAAIEYAGEVAGDGKVAREVADADKARGALPALRAKLRQAAN